MRRQPVVAVGKSQQEVHHAEFAKRAWAAIAAAARREMRCHRRELSARDPGKVGPVLRRTQGDQSGCRAGAYLRLWAGWTAEQAAWVRPDRPCILGTGLSLRRGGWRSGGAGLDIAGRLYVGNEWRARRAGCVAGARENRH